MWGPILEKAWVKVRGSYENADGGRMQNGIRLVTGAPVFEYDSALIRTDEDIQDTFQALKLADESNFILAGGTAFINGGFCGISNLHAYSFIAVFTLNNKESSGTFEESLETCDIIGCIDYRG